MPVHKNVIRTILVGAILSTANTNAETTDSIYTSHQLFEQQIRSSIAPIAGKEIVGLKVLHLSADIGP